MYHYSPYCRPVVICSSFIYNTDANASDTDISSVDQTHSQAVDIDTSHVYQIDDKAVDIYTTFTYQIHDKIYDETFKHVENCAVQ